MPHKAFITNTQTQLLSKICLSCGLPISLEQDKQGKKRVRIFGFAILDYKGNEVLNKWRTLGGRI